MTKGEEHIAVLRGAIRVCGESNCTPTYLRELKEAILWVEDLQAAAQRLADAMERRGL